MADRSTVVFARPMVHIEGRNFLCDRYNVLDASEQSDLDALLSKADAVYTYPPVKFDAALIRKASRLRVIASGGSGVDHIDVDAAGDAGVAVVRPIGAGAGTVAEHVIGLMLCLAKKLVWTDRMTRSGNFDVRWDEGFQDISGKTLAIIGYGHIGRELARMCRAAFHMKIIAFSRSASALRPYSEEGVTFAGEMEEALSNADIVSVHVPMTPGMAPVIGRRELAAMRPSAWLINTARGGVLDEEALVESLRTGGIAAAGLDVFASEPAKPDNPLFLMDNIVVSPHNAGFTAQSKQRIAMAAARDIDAVLRGVRPAGLFDQAMWPRSRAAQHTA